MPADEKTVTKIVCDNEACPGNDLKPTQREGWLFISAEVYGQPSTQTVFCSPACLSAVASTSPNPFEPQPQPETPEQLPA